MNKNVFEFKKYFNTSTYWTAIFEHYDVKGWRLSEIRANSPLTLSEFKHMAKDIEDIFNNEIN